MKFEMEEEEEYVQDVTACYENTSSSPRLAALRGRSKVTREQKALLVLSFLLAAATIAIYRLVLHSVYTSRELQALQGAYEELRANLTEKFSSEVELPCPKSHNGTSRSISSASWELHEGTCYYFSSIQSPWEESRCWCQSRGGDLVKVESRNEQIFLHQWLEKITLDHEDMFWIGLTDVEEEGSWVWVDGSPLNQSLSFWHKGQPDNMIGNIDEGQDCVRMGGIAWPDPLQAWFDRSCFIHQRFICEKQHQGGNATCA